MSVCIIIPNLPTTTVDFVFILPEAALYYLTAVEQLLKKSLRSLHLLFCSWSHYKGYSRIASVIKNYKPEVSSSAVH